jgi:hypothetical protein
MRYAHYRESDEVLTEVFSSENQIERQIQPISEASNYARFMRRTC